MNDIVEKAVSLEKRVDDRLKKLRARMSPAKTLKLPPLLEQRRQEYSLTDGFFRVQAAFDRCYVYQVGLFEEQETYGDTSIIMTSNRRDREQYESPRGVLISAGLKALDALRTNGIDLGHIVTFAHYVVATMTVDVIDGKDIKVSILNAGHISGSEDLALKLRAGELRIEHDAEDGVHYYQESSGRKWPKPIQPWMSEDI